MDLHDFKSTIKTKEDFNRFLILLSQEYKANGTEWENNTLPRFLEALTAYSHDVDGYYKNTNQVVDLNNPTWKVMADILTGAIVYE